MKKSPFKRVTYPSQKGRKNNAQVCCVNGLRPHFSLAGSVRCFHQEDFVPVFVGSKMRVFLPQKRVQDDYPFKSGQIIATLHDLGPQKGSSHISGRSRLVKVPPDLHISTVKRSRLSSGNPIRSNRNLISHPGGTLESRMEWM